MFVVGLDDGEAAIGRQFYGVPVYLCDRLRLAWLEDLRNGGIDFALFPADGQRARQVLRNIGIEMVERHRRRNPFRRFRPIVEPEREQLAGPHLCKDIRRRDRSDVPRQVILLPPVFDFARDGAVFDRPQPDVQAVVHRKNPALAGRFRIGVRVKMVTRRFERDGKAPACDIEEAARIPKPRPRHKPVAAIDEALLREIHPLEQRAVFRIA